MKNTNDSLKLVAKLSNQYSAHAIKKNVITIFQNRFIFSLMMVFSALFFSINVNGSESLSTEQREVSGFNEIEIGGAFKVILVQGSTDGVTVDACADIMKNIITKVEGNTLKIYTEEKTNSCSDMKITINFKQLKSIDCSGSVHLTATAPLKFEVLELESSGASKTELEISTTKLDINISGSGHTTLKGFATNVDLDISGSGKLMASNLTATNYDIDISGAGSAEIVVSENLKVEVSGAGIVKYYGEPKIKKEISGAGKVEKM